jgi:hypothetical protein
MVSLFVSSQWKYIVYWSMTNKYLKFLAWVSYNKISSGVLCVVLGREYMLNMSSLYMFHFYKLRSKILTHMGADATIVKNIQWFSLYKQLAHFL